MTKIGYLGPEGTYCDQATEHFMGRFEEEFHAFPFSSLPDVFSGLNRREIDAAVVPLINSIAGPYRETVEGLLKYNVVQRESFDMKIDLALGIHPSSSRERICEIRSRDTALAECSRHLDRSFPRVRRVSVGSTAAAMQETRDQKLMHVAAVGGVFGMERYGLKILDRNIEDQKDNFTTFLYLCRKE